MRKTAYLVLSVLLICTALTVFAVPASAAQQSWSDIKTAIESAKAGDVLEFDLESNMTADMEITVKVACKIRFIGNGKSPCVISSNGNSCFKIGARNVSLECKNVVFDGFETNTGGAFAKVIGENFILDGIVCKNCASNMSGGALSVSGKKCTVKNSRFENCTAKLGGAIYFYSGTTGGTVRDCTFTACSAKSGGNCVKGSNDIKIVNCTPEFDIADYSGCVRGTSEAMGSVLSDGNVWMIVAVAMIAVCAMAVLIVCKKKKNKAGK